MVKNWNIFSSNFRDMVKTVMPVVFGDKNVVLVTKKGHLALWERQ